MKDFFVSGRYSREYLNMIKNDKYLFVNFIVTIHTGFSTDKFIPKVGYVFSLEKEDYLKCKYDRFPDKSGELIIGGTKRDCRQYFFELVILSNYNNNILVAKYRDNLKLCEFKNNTFILKQIPLKIKDDDFKIIKLKNNKFIIYLDDDILFFKSYKIN